MSLQLHVSALSLLVMLLGALPAWADCPAGQESVPGLSGCFRSCPSGSKRTGACSCQKDDLEVNCTKYGLETAPTLSCIRGEYWGGLCYWDTCPGKRTASLSCERTRTVTRDDIVTNCDKYSEVFRRSCPSGYKRTAVCTCVGKLAMTETYLETDAKYGNSQDALKRCPAGTEEYGGQCYRQCPADKYRTSACGCGGVVTNCTLYGQVDPNIKPDVACAPSLRIPDSQPLDVTFLVTTDLHVGSDTFSPKSHQIHALMVSGMADVTWPDDQGFTAGGGKISPRGVVLTGDVTDWGHEWQYYLFREYWEPNRKRSDMPLTLRDSASKYPEITPVNLPVWVGLGNHDRYAGSTAATRWRDYLSKRMAVGCGDVVSLDYETSSYSWNWGRLHMIQLHEFGYGPSNDGSADPGFDRTMAWLESDLGRYASDGRPVIVFQHYALSKGESEKDWSTAVRQGQRERLLAKLAPYHVIALFAGHNHEPGYELRNGIPIFTGSTGGQQTYQQPSGIHAVRVTERALDVAFYEWCPALTKPAAWGGCPDLKGASPQIGVGPHFNPAYSRHIDLATPRVAHLPDGPYLLKNASSGSNQCLIFSGNGTAANPTRHDWGAGNEYCGFPGGKAGVLANGQAVWSLTWLEGDSYLLKNSSNGRSQCLIFSGNGTAMSPSRHDWGAGADYCGFPGGKAALLANKQAIWHLTPMGNGTYTLRNESGGKPGCLIFSGNGTAASPSRHDWGAGADQCGFPGGQAALVANKQAIWQLVPLN